LFHDNVSREPCFPAWADRFYSAIKQREPACRKATAESTFIAHRAGIRQASSATKIKKTGAAIIVAGSYGDTYALL
jgi:hypothetical protein